MTLSYEQIFNILIILAEVFLAAIILFVINLIVIRSLKKIFKILKVKPQKQTKNLFKKIKITFFVLYLILCGILVPLNIWAIYQGQDLHVYALTIIQSASTSFWQRLGITLAIILGIFVLSIIVIYLINLILDAVCNQAKKIGGITENDKSIEKFFNFLKRIISALIWIYALIFCASILGLSEAGLSFSYLVARILITLSIGLLISNLFRVIIDSLDEISEKKSSQSKFSRYYDQIQDLIPFLRKCLDLLICIYAITLSVSQIELIAAWTIYGFRIAKVLGIIIIGRIFIGLSQLLIEDIFFSGENISEAKRKRQLTIIPLFKNTTKYFIYFTMAISTLYALDINPAPILAAAGLVGLAASLGAQNLVNDIVSGFFILFENYFLVGDYISTGSAEGYVEAIELRTTRIRALDGQQYIIRNGEVGQVTNYSKQFIFAVVEVGVSYDSDLNHVSRVIEDVGLELKAENSDILAATVVQGLDNFGESELSVRTITKVKPGKHPPIRRMLRKKIKEAFDREGIEIPFAQRVVIFKNENEQTILDHKQEHKL